MPPVEQFYFMFAIKMRNVYVCSICLLLSQNDATCAKQHQKFKQKTFNSQNNNRIKWMMPELIWTQQYIICVWCILKTVNICF